MKLGIFGYSVSFKREGKKHEVFNLHMKISKAPDKFTAYNNSFVESYNEMYSYTLANEIDDTARLKSADTLNAVQKDLYFRTSYPLER